MGFPLSRSNARGSPAQAGRRRRGTSGASLELSYEAAVAKVWGDAVTDELGSGKLWWASRIVGVDLGDPEIWNDGFSVLEGFVERMC